MENIYGRRASLSRHPLESNRHEAMHTVAQITQMSGAASGRCAALNRDVTGAWHSLSVAGVRANMKRFSMPCLTIILALAILLPACSAAPPAPTPDLQAYEATVIARVVATLTAGAPPASATPQPSATATHAPTIAPTRPATATPTYPPTATSAPTSTPAPTQPPAAAATPTPTPTISLIVPRNQVFETDGWTWRLQGVQKAHIMPADRGNIVAQDAFLLVALEFTNHANALRRPDSIAPLYLLDANGYWRTLPRPESRANDAAQTAADILGGGLFRETISPGQKQTAVAAWDLPAGSGDLFLLLGNRRIYLGDFDALVETESRDVIDEEE